MEEMVKILVVDDDEVDRMAVRRALKAAGMQMELSEADDCTAIAACSSSRLIVSSRLSSTRWRRTEPSSAGALFRLLRFP